METFSEGAGGWRRLNFKRIRHRERKVHLPEILGLFENLDSLRGGCLRRFAPRDDGPDSSPNALSQAFRGRQALRRRGGAASRNPALADAAGLDMLFERIPVYLEFSAFSAPSPEELRAATDIRDQRAAVASVATRL